MTNPLYPDVTTLADCFRNLILENRLFDQAARELTADMRRKRLNFVFACTYPHFASLRWPFELIKGADDRLRVRTEDGREHDADEFLCDVDSRGGVTVLHGIGPPIREPAATDAPPVIQVLQTLPPDPVRDWLVGELNNDLASGKLKSAAEYQAMLRDKPFPGLTTREAERVWKEANETLGDKKLARGHKRTKK